MAKSWIPPENKLCGCKPKIMVVEDTEFNLVTVVNLIKKLTSAEVIEAQNGKIAVDKFKEYNSKLCNCQNRAFKLIVMDLQMPIMDGYQASKIILSQKAPPVSIVALTSYTTELSRNRSLKNGMKEVYHKPISYI